MGARLRIRLEMLRLTLAMIVQPAGMIEGLLMVTPDSSGGRWIGRTPVAANVDLWIVDGDGATTVTSLEVGLSPGWG